MTRRRREHRHTTRRTLHLGTLRRTHTVSVGSQTGARHSAGTWHVKMHRRASVNLTSGMYRWDTPGPGGGSGPLPLWVWPEGDSRADRTRRNVVRVALVAASPFTRFLSGKLLLILAAVGLVLLLPVLL